ncbi:pre-B-cell leukemia homeobox interacting protein 1b [Syngnathus acus]|uniref:pre-B-cell leukemia homeobox interacting protein 1b n=1 Tax=Syngnathus acus TaxID=161584 RepID=UPI001885D757|nr:pre-B-cell leukemia homeobox interacting protein 1b [Syngnathus acus]
MSGGNGANSSWTIVSPEETAAETVRTLEEQTKHHEQDDGSHSQPVNGAKPSSLSMEAHQDAEERKADPSDDRGTDGPASAPSSVSDAPIPSGDVQSDVAPDGADQDAFSDSLSHDTPSPDEPSGSLMKAETLGGVELTRQEERHDGTWEEERKQEGEESELLSKHTDSSEQTGSDEERPEDTESERKRLLASLERIGRIAEEEDADEEEFQLPRQRADDNMFSLNKCILGAVILVSLGTIWFSGVFMDLDEESGLSTRELSDLEEPGKQEWLRSETLPPPVDADNSALWTKLANGDQQISLLQAQLEAQMEELKAAEGQAAEGKTERLRWQEENTHLKSKVASLPVLEEENERLKRELETLPTLQRELETLRSTVSKLTVPPSGQPADRKLEEDKKAKSDMGERKESKKSERKERKDGKQAESGKRERGKSDKVKEGQGKWEEEKDWKKESRGDEGKTWKERDAKKERAEKTERKERKKDKHEKQWKGKEEEEWRKDKGETTHKAKDKWRQKGNEGFEERGKEKNWKSHNGEKERGGERKRAEDGKQQPGKIDDGKRGSHHGKGDKDRRKDGNEHKRKKDSGESKGDKSNSHKYKFTDYHQHEENVWAERKAPQQSSADSADYWTQQRKRLHRKPKQPQHCHSQEACAQAEGLHPVSFPQFESVLHAYLAKAEQAGVDSSKRDELRKLASEFFRDGVFVHDRVNFRKFVKDVSDILEDMVEGDGEEDSDLEDEMEAFGKEALEKFLVAGGSEQRKGEWRKESARGSG